MSDALIAVIAVATISVCARLGLRAGGPRLFAAAGVLLLAWGAGLYAMGLALEARWFHPFGLMTPVFLGAAIALALREILWRSLSPRLRWTNLGLPGVVWRTAGALLGAAGGLTLATAFWLLFLMARGSATPEPESASPAPGPSERRGFVEGLVKLTNRGVVRHLPLIGPLGDELEAVCFILNTDPAIRAELARTPRWKRLLDLPTLLPILEDETIAEELDRVRRGNVLALYRLQRNPLILAFCEEEAVREFIEEVRPSLIARQLAEIASR